MITEYMNKGVCSRKTIVELDDSHTIKDIRVIGGCNGNLQGLTALLKGMKAEDAIAKMRGSAHLSTEPLPSCGPSFRSSIVTKG